MESAHALGTSAGKLHIIEQLKESSGEGEEFDPSDWVETPVREIIAEMKEHPKQEDEATATPSMSPLPESTPAQNQREKEDSHDSYKNGESGGSAQSDNEGGSASKQKEKEEDEDKDDESNSGGHTP